MRNLKSGVLVAATLVAIGCDSLTEPKAAIVEVSPDTLVFLYEGEEQAVAATPRTSDGQSVTVQVSWASADTTVAVVDSAGLVTAIRTGTAVISASVDGATGTAVAAVQASLAAVGHDPWTDGSLAVFTPDGSAVRHSESRSGLRNPAWSPNGRRIVLSSRVDGTCELIVYDMVDRSMRTLYSPPEDQCADLPDWSANGLIAFVIDAAPSPTTYLIESDGSGLTAISDGGGWGVAGAPAWSPDGSRLAVDGGGETFILTPANGHRLVLSPTFQHLSWAPDGERLLARGRSYSSGYGIFVASAATGEAQRLTLPVDSSDVAPVWSPDGSKIAFLRYADTDSPSLRRQARILVMDPDGGNQREIGMAIYDYEHRPIVWNHDSSGVLVRSGVDAYIKLWLLDGSEVLMSYVGSGDFGGVAWRH